MHSPRRMRAGEDELLALFFRAYGAEIGDRHGSGGLGGTQTFEAVLAFIVVMLL